MVCYDMYCKTSPDPPYLCSILAYSSTALFVTLIAGHIVEVKAITTIGLVRHVIVLPFVSV